MLLLAGPFPTGRVVGVDLTREMCIKAQENASLCGHAAPRFAVLEASVDAVGLPAQLEAAGLVEVGNAELVVSNGVFNLCVDKRQAFLNAFALLKPGGVFLLVDMVRELDFDAAAGGDGNFTDWAD
jgi:SAM-dependent methyltransferase